MRHLLAVIATSVVLFSVTAQAQSDAPAPAAPAANPVSATAPPVTPPASDAKPLRMTWEQRFAQANTTHDGHLTLQQASGGYRLIARNFSAIDVESKGYVTEDDIRAWHKARRASRQPAPSPNSHAMQFQHAYERMFQSPFQMNTATDRTLPQPAQASQPTGPWQPGVKPNDP
jgi:hypothetical protein